MDRSASELARLERDFTEDMYENYRYLVRTADYRAERFLHLVTMHGGVAPTREALGMAEPPGGFHRLRALGLLERTVEAYVLRPEYAPLFDQMEREVARRRLEEYGFDVDAYLAAITESSR
jgi:hypothetical protein